MRSMFLFVTGILVGLALQGVGSQATGLDDLHFELLEFGPASLQRKVMDDWKP